MVGYQGGKHLASKGIAEVINMARSHPNQKVIDPFCGGLSTAVRFGGPVECSDINLALISMYQAVADGWDPPQSLSPEEWEFCKTLEDTDPHKAFAGIGCSWLNRWFLRYATTKGKENDHTTYAMRTRKALLRDIPLIIKRGGSFACRSFFDIEIEKDCVLYLDPPYYGVSGFKGAPQFDHERFWLRTLEWAHAGVPVFVSEYACPLIGADCVWTKKTPLGQVSGGARTQTECLFFISEDTKA